MEQLLIKGFQAHEQIEVVFDPKVTTIIGPSDVGKSSVLRAIRWLVTNRPLGDGFVRDGMEQAVVKLRVNGKTITRKKGNGVNSYSIGKQKLVAFGAEVPEPVSKLLRMNEVNFQGQHEAPFWFSLSAPEVARQLNSIVDLSLIDRVMSKLASGVRKARAESDVVKSRLKEAKRRRAELKWVVKANQDLTRAEEAQDLLRSRLALLRSAEKFRDDGVKYRRTHKLARQAADGGSTVLEMGARSEVLRGKVEGLVGLLAAARKVESVVRQPLPDFGKVDRLQRRVGLVEDRLNRLKSLVEWARHQERQSKQFCHGANEAKELLVRETRGRCPVCGGRLEE